jgi:DNA-directed RNA polymerase II subunit RPB2
MIRMEATNARANAANTRIERDIQGTEARDLAERILKVYFETQEYPYTRHHIESFDQFLSADLPAILQAQNPIILLQDRIGSSDVYAYKLELFIGGMDGQQIYIGSPTVALKNSEEIRLLFPNEARLRNLTYSSMVEADVVVRVTFSRPNPAGGAPVSQEVVLDPVADPARYGYLRRFPLCRMPIMLHSRFCQLHGKPQGFIKEAGECVHDHGGYFIINGSEKVLITHQEQAFNTFYITPQESDPKTSIYSSILCLNPKTRQVKRVAFNYTRPAPGTERSNGTILVTIPYVRSPIPLFVLFRALGVQSDEDILRLIFPDPEAAETKLLQPLLHESILEAVPIFDSFSAVQYIKTLTKGFSEAHVLDILYNQLFIHVENRPRARATFLAESVRRILRVKAGIDQKTDRDDTRNQRCLTSGILCRQLFQGAYQVWVKAMRLKLDSTYKNGRSMYQDENFLNLFAAGTMSEMFMAGMLSDSIMKAFRGKWSSGSGAGVGEEKSGVLQALSRLSYMDFMSHCRRVVLDFDTGMKLPSPRRLHTSQYGYFCTSETPGGASIGISKNLSMLTSVSTATDPAPFIDWLYTRAEVMKCEEMTPALTAISVPVFVNAGIVGFTLRPIALRDTLKALKWTGCLPSSASVGFSIRDRRVFIYLDEGRPMRPLIHLGPGGKIPLEALKAAKSWRNLVFGVLPQTESRRLDQAGFYDPLASDEEPTLEKYIETLLPNAGVIEYLDPYEMNEAYLANYPEHIQPETSHMEIHPSTIVGLLTSMIPYANHNQSPRNQLSCSQSKQGIAVYSTAFNNRFDNRADILSYPEAPISRTVYYDYLANGEMGYGTNLILAMGSFTGYNQDDGILMNADSVERGMFRSVCHRGYEAFEEDDPLTKGKTRIGNPAHIPAWTSLKPGIDYSKLDERGVIRVGELVDETTVLVGRYLQTANGDMMDNSVTAQVWTRGRVEKVSVTLSNQGFAMVKVRVTQERLPELGDKFSNRHGQKGTIGMLLRGYDMPRRPNGIPLDMIMNPHAIPSRMTVAQLLEALVGKASPALGATANTTLFFNEGNPSKQIGDILRDQLGMEPLGEELLYDGMSGQFIPSQIFVGNVYTMRLRHMPEDKWNARGAGRREQRTHQPTGGRGAQGGLRIGEMERDAISGHGTAYFLHERLMKCSDAYETYVCNGCGTIPIYNEKERLFICSMCDGPVRYIGSTANDLEIMPPTKRSVVTFTKIQMPYAVKLLEQEMNGFLNMGMRFLSDQDMRKLRDPPFREISLDQEEQLLAQELPQRVYAEFTAPEQLPQPEEEEGANLEDLARLGAVEPEGAAEAAAVVDGLAAAAPAGLGLAPAMPVGAAANNAAPVLVLQPSGANNGAITLGASAPAAAPPAGDGALEEADLAGMPEAGTGAPPFQLGGPAFNSAAPPASTGAPPPLPPGGGVNVQTSSQPVLVIPVGVGTSAPTQFLPPPLPGAPGTLAVDTGAGAMAAAGLPAVSMGAPAAGNGVRRNNSRNAARPGGNGSAAAPGATVSVNKLGAGNGMANGAAAAGANVRVTVNKTG